jgi:hypothetical protein
MVKSTLKFKCKDIRTGINSYYCDVTIHDPETKVNVPVTIVIAKEGFPLPFVMDVTSKAKFNEYISFQHLIRLADTGSIDIPLKEITLNLEM